MQVPSNGAAGFLNDYTVELHPKPLTKHTIILCESCDSKDKAVAYCQDCEGHLCEACITSHSTIKFLRNHKVKKLSSSKKPISLSKKATTIYCNVHPRKELDLYCLTCQRVVCTRCLVSSHNKHEFGSISSDTRHVVEKQVRQKMTKLVNKKLAFLREKFNEVKKVEKDKMLEQTKLTANVNDYFDSLMTTIENQRDDLLKEIKIASNKYLKTVWAEKDLLGNLMAATESALLFADRSLKCTNHIEFLLIGAQLKDRLQQLSETEWDSTTIEYIKSRIQEFVEDTSFDVTRLVRIKTGVVQ